MKKHLIIIVLAMVGLFLGTNGFTQEKMGPAGGTGKTAEGLRINAFMVEKIIGSQVMNGKGETLGKIGDLVVDIDTGQIVYAVLESGGFLGIGEKLIPIPWESLATLPSEGIFILNRSKEQMAKAPAFDKNNLPDIADMNWGMDIFKHYGIPGDVNRGTLGNYGYGYGYGGYGAYYGHYGYPMHRGPVREDPYTKIFDSKTIKTISGQVIKVDHVPDPGFGMEMRLTVFIDKKEILPVYLGPASYIVGSEQAKYFKRGDRVTVTGSQVTVRGETFILATTVKRGDEVLRLRSKDGTPEWVGWKKASD
ncbi:MAG: PRC-barrel domain-containing protein [Deltaproteobacteria bacterium]|nr:PRC-barrel domain-containing protein [Deltaproteobacteria bacterium]